MKHFRGMIGGAVMAIAMSTTGSFAANLVTNGDFSSGLSGWSTTATVNAATDADYIAHAGASGSSGFANYAAFGGGNQPGGSIWETLSTTVGHVYNLTFYYGGYGSTNTQTLDWSIGSLSSFVSVPAKWLSTDLTGIFNKFSLTFTATSANTVLKFADVSAHSANADMLLGKVSVTAVPGPAAGAGLPAALLGVIGFALLRRRKSANFAA